jgi:arabinose-5-phosphate isomerase
MLQGTIFLSGVGKSGIIAKKIAVTMSSSGTKALYLSPLNALHGDIGLVTSGDAVLFLSKSGETDELLHLCPAIRNKGARLISVVSSLDSRLAKACDLNIVLPVSKELCPFNMVPTTSTMVQLIFGDLLAIALMNRKQFTVDDFAQNHPAGRIGKRMTFTVRDLMITGDRVPLAAPENILIDALSEFSGKQCGCLLVIDAAERLLGIFTDGDLRRSLQRHGAMVLHKSLRELMTTTPRFIHAKMLAYDAMKFMEADPKRPITVVPVVEDGKVVGILKMHDIVQSGI